MRILEKEVSKSQEQIQIIRVKALISLIALHWMDVHVEGVQLHRWSSFCLCRRARRAVGDANSSHPL